MKKRYYSNLSFLFTVLLLISACRDFPTPSTAKESGISSLQDYVDARSRDLEWSIRDSIVSDGYRVYVLHFISQEWLTESELMDPQWWHWMTVVVPDSVQNDISLLFISGGSRHSEQPAEADSEFVQMALQTHSVTAKLHNVPNQPLEFVADQFGPRDEDEIIAYGWRKFLEAGATEEHLKWLARMPMTTAAVVAMDVLEELGDSIERQIGTFVVAGGSKRGWTTWTTAAVDSRVIAIAPIVIDILNVVPSFAHHWRAYGKWAPAVNDYEREGIMEWQHSAEYARLIRLTEPYSLRASIDMPKMILNATGDQFFLPDSWQFYWSDLVGEKHLRYVPNSEHSMRDTDAWITLIAFYKMIIEGQDRPDFSWSVQGDTIHMTMGKIRPDSIKVWRANNPQARNFQVDSIGRAYQASPIEVREDGKYKISVGVTKEGWTASFVELAFHERSGIPLKLSTGVIVRPDIYPYDRFVSQMPKGTPLK